MIFSERIIHYLNLDNDQIHLLKQIETSDNYSVQEFGTSEVRDRDFILISYKGDTKEIISFLEKFNNKVFLLSERELPFHIINKFNRFSNIVYIDSIISDCLISYLKSDSSLITNNLDDTLAIISHDLKNPLCAIRLDAQILQRKALRGSDLIISQDVKLITSRMIKTIDRLGLIINDLLDSHSNSSTGLTLSLIKSTDIIDEVLEVMAPLAKRNSIKLKKITSKGAITFRGDYNKLFQVILNLVSNAIKFSNQHSSVTISTHIIRNQIEFSIEDQGPGISSTIESSIYDKFQTGTSQKSGSGLGLYICKKIILSHGGEIFHKTGPNGTKFIFHLPIKQEQTEGAQVYLVERDNDLRDAVSWALNSYGIRVESYSSGVLALNDMKKSNKIPSLLLTSFRFDDLNFDEFVALKDQLDLNNLPHILMTSAVVESSSYILKNKNLTVFPKPIDLGILIKKVHSYLSIIS